MSNPISFIISLIILIVVLCTILYKIEKNLNYDNTPIFKTVTTLFVTVTVILIFTTSSTLKTTYEENPQDHFKVRDTVRINLEAPGSKPFVMKEKDDIYTVPLNQEFTRTKSVPSDEIHVVDVPGQSAFAVTRYEVNKLWYNPGTWFLDDDLTTYVWYK